MKKNNCFRYYCLKWRQTVNQLMDAMKMELEPLNQNETAGNLKLQRQDIEWFRYFGKLYIFYVDAYNALEECYDALIHPQKRQLLRRMLENCMLRMIQIKKSIIYFSTEGDNVKRSEFVNLDTVLMEQKRIMQSIEVKLPRYFSDESVRKREYRNQLLEKFLLQFHETTQPEVEVYEDLPILDSVANSIRYIQKMERARQGIERAYLAQWLKKLDIKKQEKHKRLQEGTEIAEETERDDGILVIQKYYRGYLARAKVWEERQQEQVFLGFQRPIEASKENTTKHQQYRRGIKKIQSDHQVEYKQALNEAKEQLINNWQDEIKDNMLKDRRDWYWSEIQKTEGKLIPPKVEQFYKKDDVRLPLTELEQEEMDIAEKERKSKKKDKKKKKKKKKNEELEEKREEQGPTEAVINIQNQIESYTNNWDRRDEDWNFKQQFDPELLKEEIADNAEKQIRKMVDQMIDIELVNLRVCLKAKKHKYPKDGSTKGKSNKKKKKKVAMPKPESDEGEIIFQFRSPKKKKKKRFPGEKLSAKRDPRDLLVELIEAGIVKKLQPARIEELIGDPYPLRYKQELLQEKVADPSLFDLRQALIQFVGLPLGSSYVRDNLNKETNYYLFYGPSGSGKTHAVRALQTECNALVIDLSPSNLINKFTEKQDYLLNISFKVAGFFQPSIIYIDEIEKIFKVNINHPSILYYQGKKKKKKKSSSIAASPEINYTKLRKFLIRFGKFYTEKEPENVAIIGCTNSPWDANKKQLKSFFKRRFYFPTPNYSTRLKLFQYFFKQKNIELHPQFPLSSLAHVTEGFSAGNIKLALDKVLSLQRIGMANQLPYRLDEFIQPLANQRSLLLDIYLKFRDLHDDLSGNKARIEKLKAPEEDANTKNKNNKNQNKKKK